LKTLLQLKKSSTWSKLLDVYKVIKGVFMNSY